MKDSTMPNPAPYYLIAGSYFRPPAKQLMQILPQGTPVLLEAQPDNPYDAWAIAVMLDPGAVLPALSAELKARLEAALTGTGQIIEDLLLEPRIQLGFIAASEGKPLAKARLECDGFALLEGNRELGERFPGALPEGKLVGLPNGGVGVELMSEPEALPEGYDV
jgi:hypothetical protein